MKADLTTSNTAANIKNLASAIYDQEYIASLYEEAYQIVQFSNYPAAHKQKSFKALESAVTRIGLRSRKANAILQHNQHLIPAVQAAYANIDYDKRSMQVLKETQKYTLYRG